MVSLQLHTSLDMVTGCLVLEQRDEVGGCASTVSVLGTRVNICSCDHSMVLQSGIIEELGLNNEGLRYLNLDPVKHFRVIDGSIAARPWWLFNDAERTVDGLGECHPGSEVDYGNYLRDALPMAKQLLEFMNSPPSLLGVIRSSVKASTVVSRLLKLQRLSADQAMSRWFRSEALRAPAAASSIALWGMSPLTPGTGLASLGYALSHLMPTARPVGAGAGLFRMPWPELYAKLEARLELGRS